MTPLAALLDLLLPRRCVGCGSVVGPLCPRCLPSGPVVPAGGDISAAARYDGAIRTALLNYKERGRRDLGRPLGDLLAGAVRDALRPGRSPPGAAAQRVAVLVPVPSARSVAAARGGDHVLRLARRACARTGVRVAPDALVLTRSVRDSAGLGSAERSANLAEAMAARPGPPGTAAVIVDDIVTTGATLLEARRALDQAGWTVLGAAVVAATPRRTGRTAGNHWQPAGARSSVRTT
jgi:predicted amidophosphoribosyltransferase